MIKILILVGSLTVLHISAHLHLYITTPQLLLIGVGLAMTVLSVINLLKERR